MEIKRNIRLDGPHGKPLLADVFYRADGQPKPVVIFVHGFKGFKDWGHFNLIARQFAEAGFAFVKFNFSHCGATPEHPDEFADLEAFGHNNFSIEMDDLGAILDWVSSRPEALPEAECDTARLFLTGHSRGGGIALLKAREDSRVKKVATWASVCEFGHYWSEAEMEEWKAEGVKYIKNSRTGQNMPLYYQMYEDYFANKERLHIPTAVRALEIPVLLAHCKDDEAVPFSAAIELHGWNPRTRLFPLNKGGHTFEGRHPWPDDHLPPVSQKVVDATIHFFE